MPPIEILSLGAGVQSSTLAMMAKHGEIDPMPAVSIFSDTGAEPPSVYKWLEWLKEQLPFEVLTVAHKRTLTEESLYMQASQSKPGTMWSKSLIPAHVANPDGTKGIMGRQCTYGHKLMPIMAKTREIVGNQVIRDWRKRHKEAHDAYSKAKKAKRVCPRWAWQEMQEDALVVQWIGISLDEISRMKPAMHPWIRNRWPLIEKGMKRHDALLWMERHGYPKPPRSACTYCPFHSDDEWRRLRDEEPEEFAKAAQFEKDLQRVKGLTENMMGKPFLHASLKPLEEVDFSTATERGQGDLFGNDCEGLCGV